MAANDASVAELKQLLVTGSNHAAWSGDHLVRYLVDWYQRNEREIHSNLQSNLMPPRFPSFCISPSESLINSTLIIPKLVSEGKADVIIDTLRVYSQLPYVDKEAMVLCLAVASKQGDQKKLVTDAHSAVRELCRSTHLFFLFIQISKMISKQSGHTGWGRGLRRAVNEWYLSWEPQRLALEVTRHSSAHGWTHRDVIRLAHLKLKELPLGTQVVLHYVFRGLEKTVQEYTGKDNTSDLLDLMKILDKDGHPQDGEVAWDVDQVINKVNKLQEVYGSLTLDDVPSQSLKSPEVWSHMLDKLEGESAVASVSRMSKANLLNPGTESNALPMKLVDRLKHQDVTEGSITPTQVLMALHAYKHPTRFVGGRCIADVPRMACKVKIKRPVKVNTQVADALHALIATSAKSIAKTSRKLAVCVDVRASMVTSHVHTGNPEGKGEVSCTKGAAVTILTLTSGGSNPAVSTLAFSGDSLVELQVPEGANINMLTEKFKETAMGLVNVEAALKWAVEKKVETVVVLSLKFEPHSIAAITETVKQVNEKNNTQIRVVLCGLAGKFMDIPRSDNFLLALGFDQRTPCIIRAFHERHF